MKESLKCYPTLYPVEPWQITEDSYCPDKSLLSETIFALANGYLGIRGSFEEGFAMASSKNGEGIYLNGFFESVPIPHAEKGYGYAVNTQTMLNVTNSKIIEIYIAEERFTMDSGKLLNYRRSLDMKHGLLYREITWRSPGGREIEFQFKRFASYCQRHLLSFQLNLKPLNFSGPVTIVSSIDGDVDNYTHEDEDPRFSAALKGLGLGTAVIETFGTASVMLQKTQRSELSLACAMHNVLREEVPCSVKDQIVGNRVSSVFDFHVAQQKIYSFEKHVSYYTSREYAAGDLTDRALDMSSRAGEIGFVSLLEEQNSHCRKYWDTVGVEINGAPEIEQGLRFNLFQLLQAAGSRGQTGIAAKGLTSEGYDGHYFWDTEIYMIPFYAATIPSEARKLLEYRYSILDHARSRARELSHPTGALYPWRTIAGEEGSSYYPAGTAQYHINAAIAYAIYKYLVITEDNSFLLEYGAEIIFETARLWEDLGAYIPSKGNLFCYNEVTGPDEYTALVNNNCYTNLMARWHLKYAHDTARLMEREYSPVFKRISGKIGLKGSEVKSWLDAAENMYIPYDQDKKIHPQDDGFFDKEVWDFASTPPDKYPLLLYYHPLVIYRYQVCKQPDVVLAQLLLEDIFKDEQKKRNYKYYEEITTHDSSLSPSIFSSAASDLMLYEKAEKFFRISVRLDLDNILKDTHFGVHMANMAGSWQALVHGFAGMRTKDGKLCFKPYLPRNWNSYSFKLNYRGAQLEVIVDSNNTRYRLLKGDILFISHENKDVTLSRCDNEFCSNQLG